MIKRALAVALCLMLVFALLPKTALATNATSVYIWDCELDSTKPYYHNGTNGVQGTVNNDSNGANAHYDPTTGVLMLRDLNVVGYYIDAGGIRAMGHGVNDLLTIELEGVNTVSMYADSAIHIQDCSLSIEGSGTLTATGGFDKYNWISCGIDVGGDITISGGSVTGTGGEGGAGSHGVHAAGSITVSGGALIGEGKESASSSGVTATSSITASGGSITGTGGVATSNQGYSCGVYVEADSGFIRVVNGGSITGTGKEAYKGSSYGLYADGAIDMIKEEGSSDTDGGSIKGTADKYSALVGCGVWTRGQISLPADNFRIEGKGERAFESHPNSFPGDGVYYWRTDENGAYEHSDGWRAVYSELYFDVRSPLPVITFSTQPASTTVTEGNITGSLTAAASASPGDEVTLNWYACDAGGTPAGSSLGTGGTFAIPTTLTARTYHYLCQAACPGATSVNSNVATVTVNAPPPTVTSVAVSPATANVVKGGNKEFSATVTGANSPAQTVTWTVEGKNSASTSISTGGVLSVGSDETAAAITVKATSTVDTGKSGTATVTVTAPAPTGYEITQGQNGQWIQGSGIGLGFTANGDYSKFTGVLVDGAVIANSNYTSQSGSTIVTLNAAYLETLTAGWHTLRINFTDGFAETDFFVAVAGGAGGDVGPDVPQTGDAATPVLWIGILLLAGAGLAIRRKWQNG